MCEGLEFQSLSDATTPGLCADGRCMDEILLQDMATQVRAKPGDRVVVLHQLGNHGPAYFERYPAAFARFKPTCDTRDIGRCSREEITNSYDNTTTAIDIPTSSARATIQTGARPNGISYSPRSVTPSGPTVTLTIPALPASIQAPSGGHHGH